MLQDTLLRAFAYPAHQLFLYQPSELALVGAVRGGGGGGGGMLVSDRFPPSLEIWMGKGYCGVLLNSGEVEPSTPV